MSSNTDAYVFSRHSDSVLCCSIDKNTRIAVSGGIDDKALVWDLNTKHVIFECVGHKESVVAAAFSVNSTYVATGDLNGYVQVRNTTTGLKIFEYDVDEINWIMWHNTSEFILLAGTTEGDFWMWNVNDPASVKTFPSYGFATSAAKLLSDGVRLVSGYGDGSVRVFDLKTQQAIIQHNDPTQAEIICLDLNHDNSLVAVGCIGLTVKLLNLHSGKLIGTLSCENPAEVDGAGANTNNSEEVEVVDEYSVDMDRPLDQSAREGNEPEEEEVEAEEEDEEDQEGIDDNGDVSSEDDSEPINSVESVFSSCGSYLAASSNTGSIFIWDVASQKTRCELHTGVGITRCVWSANGNYITGCLDGFVRIYDLNLNKLNEIPLHSDQILDVALQNGLLVTASEDRTCRTTLIGES